VAAVPLKSIDSVDVFLSPLAAFTQLLPLKR
jgi:hypothetical protein